MSSPTDPLLVPVQLQAFLLNPAVCNTGRDDDHGARIVPITQPNYTFLRLDNFLIQGDVLNHADMHNAAPAEKNSRMTDLGARPEAVARRNRHGVYVHWILPQVYRTGLVSSDSVSKKRREEERLKRGLPPLVRGPESPKSSDTNTPEFLQPPTRWIIIRKLDKGSIEPAEASSKFNEYQAWVIESDYLWKLDDIPADYDLEVDVSPFVVGMAGETVDIPQQAEIFIGRKTPLEDWKPAQGAEYANISLLRSGNELFADFQLHNTNVFSILDNFAYDGETSGQTEYLDKADASYYLLGWHSTDGTDPLWDGGGKYSHSERLESLFMTLVDSGIPEITEPWLDSSAPARLCFHGALYDVKWDHGSKPKSVPADDYSNRLQNQEVPSLSVGTTPMDALISYLKARTGHEAGSVAKLEEDILAIDSLLHARDDGVEGQREAKHTLYNWNFSRFKGGKHFFLGGQDSRGKPTKPDSSSIRALSEVNQLQQLLEGCLRLSQQRRWDMFSLWWKYVSDVSNKAASETNSAFKDKADALLDEIGKIQAPIDELERKILVRLQHDVSLRDSKVGTMPFFYRARDPTLLIGGVDSGWPSDFSDNVKVRLPQQVVDADTIPDALMDLVTKVKAALPNETLSVAVNKQLNEFFVLQPEQDPPEDPPQGKAYPQFHDAPNADNVARDQWGDRQPWFPLYVEWEAEYTHVPFELWALDEFAVRVSDYKMLRYGIETENGKPLWEEIQDRQPLDTRILSGRVLILPQPSFSLAAKVRQLFADTPAQILEQYLPEPDREELLKNIDTLSYLSCPLTGLTEGLLTLGLGAHIKPENKDMTAEGEQVNTAIKAAEFVKAGFTESSIKAISGNSAMTPFSSSVDFTDADYCPFKPATHGQMRFRKLNIIDKFGQAIVTIDPQPRKAGPPPLYPCVSDFYEPQVVKLPDGTHVANTVIQNNGGNCELVQLPPQINQPARFNSNFVVATSSKGFGPPTEPRQLAYWRPATEWENPIWGWIVINYADYGLQLFLADGTFYGEVRIGGPNGTLASPKWSPFEPPATVSEDTARLDALIKRLKLPEYLKGFWAMITDALASLPAAPGAYAQFLGSVVGKPLALVNMGWSLELAGPPLVNQSTASKIANPERELIGKDPSTESSPSIEPGNQGDTSNIYEFHLKLGNREVEYDGLVGYFDGFAQPDEETQEELAYDYVNTYFIPKDKRGQPKFDNLRPLSSKTYPKFQAYWVPPLTADGKRRSAAEYTDQQNQKLRIYGAIVDPFTAIHGYSSFLPAQSLALQPWTWQGAMDNMLAFLHAGPLTLAGDVGGYDKSQRLTTENAKEKPARNVGLPAALQALEWSWLQPYVDPDDPGAGTPVFNAYGIEKKGNLLSPGFQMAPYTAVEGYLQLRRPIMVEKPDALRPKRTT
ncbi:hypothetical protein ANO14919_135940 [Xylariales sp. No.14919]|nr:hypothetical protein ANO14919_135940 [Xylariales sp. No.14919]